MAANTTDRLMRAADGRRGQDRGHRNRAFGNRYEANRRHPHLVRSRSALDDVPLPANGPENPSTRRVPRWPGRNTGIAPKRVHTGHLGGRYSTRNRNQPRRLRNRSRLNNRTQSLLASIPGKYPDPLPPDSSEKVTSHGETLQLLPSVGEVRPRRSVVNSAGVVAEPDQTRWIHKEFLTTDLLCLLLSSCAAVYCNVAAARYVSGTMADAGDVKTQFALLFLMTVLVAHSSARTTACICTANSPLRRRGTSGCQITTALFPCQRDCGMG